MMYGNLSQGIVMNYSDDCIQSIIAPDDWWVKYDTNKICRGALIYTFIPHVDQLPYTFEPIGRSKAEQHDRAEVNVKPLKVGEVLKQAELPVAAMPLYGNEVWAAYRAKKRPCLTLGTNFPTVDSDLTKKKPKSSTANTTIVAPFYGADENNNRAGYTRDFIERVRHLEYPQFHWDSLPNKNKNSPKESILRLDHLQPVGSHYMSYKLSGYKLSDEAMNLIDELVNWQFLKGFPKDSLLIDYRKSIESNFL